MKISARRASIAASSFLVLAAPAAAQNGATWATGDTGITTMIFAGGNGPPPVPADLTPADMALLFKTVCLDAGGNPDSIQAAIAANSLPLEPAHQIVSQGKKKPPVQVHLWRGPGVVVARTDGFFGVPAQCNATFYPVVLPDRAVLAEALSARFGLAPNNEAQATKKDGKPNKYYSPRWTIAGGATAPRSVNAVAMRGSRYMPGDRVLMAVRPGEGTTR